MKWIESTSLVGKVHNESGRNIVDESGNILFKIKKEGMSPTEADAITEMIVEAINSKDFDKYYENYMKL